MNKFLLFCSLLVLFSCQPKNNASSAVTAPNTIQRNEISFDQVVSHIHQQRKEFAKKIISPAGISTDSIRETITNYWIKSVAEDLYNCWQNTPWDFNGVASMPGTEPVACGYFVTAILQNMGLHINRVKLSTCPSMQMMKSLEPGQKIINLSSRNYTAFDQWLRKSGKGVYIIGLDFHTGFIVNDGNNNYFIHSNYINRKGVCKEPVLQSAALKASKTRWLISLTGDNMFLLRWLKENDG